ncbi:RNA polymerase sigma factor [Gordonia rhizosphera]|nr:sigma-70 family RNA polymerase sigma factor [Gordonia rhizosphera]
MSAPLDTGGNHPPDHVIVAALRGGDMDALATAYDRYGPALHTFAYSMVRSRERAADVTHDSFLVAVARIDQLRDPSRLRPWLYAIVRSECLRMLRGDKRETAFEDWHDQAAGDDPDDDLHRREVQELVRSALDGLSPKDREIVELSLRHDLDNAEISAVLGVKPSHVTALTSRSRKALERSLGTLLVARAGGEGCDELTELLGHWDGVFTPLWRKRIAKHVDSCAVCTGERRRRFTPAAILVALPLIAAPIVLRDRVLSDAEPVLVAYSQHAGDARAATMVPQPVTAGGEPQPEHADASPTVIGGRAAWDYPTAERAGHRWWMWATAAIVALVVAGGVLAAAALTVGGSDPLPEPVVDDASTTLSTPSSSSTTTAPPLIEPPGIATTPELVVPGTPPTVGDPVSPEEPVSEQPVPEEPVISEPVPEEPTPPVSPPQVPDPAPPDPVLPDPVLPDPVLPDPRVPPFDPGLRSCLPACAPITSPTPPRVN